ncbi:MAG: hypothetical protein QM820_19280 [Minicystis sp.]
MRALHLALPLFGLVLWTSCASTETTTTCTETPTALPAVGQRIEIEAPSAFDTPLGGEYPLIASNGTVHLAVWRSTQGLYTARIDGDGAPLDIPPRAIPTENPWDPTLVWDGARFVSAWVFANQENPALPRVRLGRAVHRRAHRDSGGGRGVGRARLQRHDHARGLDELAG